MESGSGACVSHYTYGRSHDGASARMISPTRKEIKREKIKRWVIHKYITLQETPIFVLVRLISSQESRSHIPSWEDLDATLAQPFS